MSFKVGDEVFSFYHWTPNDSDRAISGATDNPNECIFTVVQISTDHDQNNNSFLLLDDHPFQSPINPIWLIRADSLFVKALLKSYGDY